MCLVFMPLKSSRRTEKEYLGTQALFLPELRPHSQWDFDFNFGEIGWLEPQGSDNECRQWSKC